MEGDGLSRVWVVTRWQMGESARLRRDSRTTVGSGIRRVVHICGVAYRCVGIMLGVYKPAIRLADNDVNPLG